MKQWRFAPAADMLLKAFMADMSNGRVIRSAA